MPFVSLASGSWINTDHVAAISSSDEIVHGEKTTKTTELKGPTGAVIAKVVDTIPWDGQRPVEEERKRVQARHEEVIEAVLNAK